MTIPPSNPVAPPLAENAPRRASSYRVLVYGFVFCAFLLMQVMAGVFLPLYFPAFADWHTTTEKPLAPFVDVNQALQRANARIDALEAKVGQLSERDTRTDGPLASARESASSDQGKVGLDVAALSAAVKTLEGEVKETAGQAGTSLGKMQIVLSETLAYFELRSIAVTGLPFGKELSILTGAAKNDERLKEPLSVLNDFKDKGAPSLSSLREQLDKDRSDLEVAVAKSDAHEWWQRLMAEFRGVISIHPLHGKDGDGDMLDLMEKSVADDDLPNALQQLSSLPEAAQSTLAHWRAEAEARIAINRSLQAIAAGLLAEVNGSHDKDLKPDTVPLDVP